MKKISNHLTNLINSIPELPGIYKMLNSKGNIIYIGKSNCLEKRVKSYFVEYRILPVQMDQDTFHDNLLVLKEILSSDKKTFRFISQIEKKMKEAASLYRYETASFFRDLIQGLQYIKHGVSGYQTLLSKNIVLKIPTQNGFKLFFVSYGMIRLKENHLNLTNSDFDSFILRGQALTPISKKAFNEKSYIDFRDILCSEINSLQENMVIILD